MTRTQALLLCSSVLAWSAQAHEGEDHHEAAAAPQSVTLSTEKPQRLENGDLYVPKSMQRLLGIRTEVLAPGNVTTSLQLKGEVASRPEARTVTSSPQAGVLEAPPDGWPLPGATVKAGQILAYLRPQMTQRDAARRSAQVVDFEQRTTMAEINAERLRLQSSAAQGQMTPGNVYYEQSLAELEATKTQRDEVVASLADRLPLRAATAGILIRNNLRAGELVATGQPIFEVSNPSRLRVTAVSFKPRLVDLVQSASLVLEDQRHVQLRLRGQEPLSGQPGWRLLFDVVDTDTRLSPGMPVDVALNVSSDSRTQQLSKACVIGKTNSASVWLHVEPERFEQRRVASCSASTQPATASSATPKPFNPGDRLVVAGGALLSQYH